MDELTLVSQTTTTAQAYSFRFKWGWAIFTLNDGTGELSIHSDWGTYGHRWRTDALGSGQTLHTFLAKCDGDYVVRKLQLDTQSKDLEREIDKLKTRRAVTERICEYRRERRITREDARHLYLLAERWTRDEGDISHGSCPDELNRFLQWHAYEYIERRESGRFMFIRNKLWPFFTAWLRENVVAPNAAPAEVARG